MEIANQDVQMLFYRRLVLYSASYCLLAHSISETHSQREGYAPNGDEPSLMTTRLFEISENPALPHSSGPGFHY
jgi:hypothetical protein